MPSILDGILPPQQEDQDSITRRLYPWLAPPPTTSGPMPTPALQPTPPMARPVDVPHGSTPAPVPMGPSPQPVSLGPGTAAPKPTSPPTQPVTLGSFLDRPAPMPQPPPQAKPGLGAKLTAVALGLSGGMPGIEKGIEYYRGVKDKPIADFERQQKQQQEQALTEETMARASSARSEVPLHEAEARKADAFSKTKPIVVADEEGNPRPALQNELTGEVTDTNGNIITLPKMWEKPAASKTPTDEDKKITDRIAAFKELYPGGDIASNRAKARLDMDRLEADAKRDPNAAVTKNTARLDRSYDLNIKELDQERKPLEETMHRLSAGLTNLNLKTAQADTFLAPQILSISAGGSGSGLRMNEAEISRILAGRTTWEAVQAWANKWSADPQHVQIPEDQRQAMADVLKAAQDKGTLKSGIIEWADSALINAEDVNDHRTIVAQARKLLTAVDEGKHLQRNKTTGEFRIAGEESAAPKTPAAAQTIKVNPNP